MDFSADWSGFSIPNEFVVGYGLDYAGKFRQLPYVGTLAKRLQIIPLVNNPIRKTYDWTLSLAKKKTASIWLGIISFYRSEFLSQFHLIFFSFHFAWEQYVRPYFSQQFAQSHLSWVVLQGMVLDILLGMDYRNISINLFLDSLKKNFLKLQFGMKNGDGP